MSAPEKTCQYCAEAAGTTPDWNQHRICDEHRKVAVCPECNPEAAKTIKVWLYCGTHNDQHKHGIKVAQRLAYLRVDDQAREELKREKERAKRHEMPKPLTVAERFTLPYVPDDWRIQQWQLVGQRVGLNAQWKAGKTTAMVNLACSLADERPWLGQYEVKRPEGRVAVLDFEMADDRPGPLDEWYRRNGLERANDVLVYGMRGQARAFNLIDDEVMAWWLDQLQQEGVGYVILDCLRPVLDAAELNEHSETGALLVRFDELLDRAKVREAVLVQHMGHQKSDGSAAGRARGDSRLMDWPDVSWSLEREKPNDPRSRRYMSAYGRGVDVDRQWLVMDDHNRLTVAQVAEEMPQDNAAAREARELRVAVLKVIRDHGASGRPSIKGALPSVGSAVKSNEKIDAALEWLKHRRMIHKARLRDPFTLTPAGLAYLVSDGRIEAGLDVEGAAELARLANQAAAVEAPVEGLGAS